MHSGAFIDRLSTLLNPENFLIFDHEQGVVSASPAEKYDSNLFDFAKKLSVLPNLAWLHLVTFEEKPVFVLSYPINQNQIAFLTYPSTTRICQMEENLVLLQKSLSNQTPDQITSIVLGLTVSDLKTDTIPHPRQDEFLSIFSDLDKFVIKTYPTPPNLGDTQPISI